MSRHLDRDIEKAKALFYKRDFAAAYIIYKRLYDRLPFEVTPEHAENIAYFSRVLLELGKEYEIKFYLNSIERLHEKQPSLELSYQLAAIKATGPEWALDYKKAKALFEIILRSTNDKRLLARTKMFLAYVLDCESEDISGCHQLVFSIEKTEDVEIDSLVEVWKAKVLRDEKKYIESEQLLEGLLVQIPFEKNWYVHFSILNILAIMYLRTERTELALKIYNQMKAYCEDKKMCVTERAIKVLEKEIKRASEVAKLTVVQNLSNWEIKFGKISKVLSKSSAAERLTRFLLQNGFLEKEQVIKILFNREFNDPADKKTVYYHIHNLRKFFDSIGIPMNSLVLEENGYRFLPEVQFVEA